MKPVRVQEAATRRIEEIYRYSLEQWGETQADAYITGMFEAIEGIASGTTQSRSVPVEFGVSGNLFRYRRHFVYWKTLSDGSIGIVTILHERMHQLIQFREDYEP